METVDIFRIAVLKILAQRASLTQAELARRIDDNPTCLNDFLHGRRNYPDYKRERISSILGYTYTEILKYGEELTRGRQNIRFLETDEVFFIGKKKIRFNTVFAKVRFILSQNGSEKKLFLDLIDIYYKSSREKTDKPKKKRQMKCNLA